MAAPITNISGYRYVPLDQPEKLRAYFKPLGEKLSIKGTIQFSPEGINVMAAGPDDGIEQFIGALDAVPELQSIWFKRSYSEDIPYIKWCVKLKPHLVPLQKKIDWANVAPDIEPATLKQWFDEGRDFSLLDMRNDLEYNHGTFDGAINPKTKHFRQFTDVEEKFDPALKQKTVVIFCTGGIRCEKASAYLIEKGYESVYKLKGGIMNYFKQCGGAHWHGFCFVFDDRELLNPDLTVAPAVPSETGTAS